MFGSVFGDIFGQVFAPFGKVQSTDDRIARRARENKIIEANAKGAAAAGSLLLVTIPQPWGALAAASAELTALAFKVAVMVRGRGDKILTGDAKAIAGFIRRAGRWNAEKRKRVAVRLHKQLERLQKHAARKGGAEFAGREERAERKEARQERRAERHGKHGRVSDTLAIHIRAHQMKIAALVALEVESRKDRHSPVVGDEPRTVPALVEADPSAGMPDAGEASFSAPGGVPLSYWIAGAAGIGVLAVVLSRNSRSAA